jgi:kynurenine formamidase
MSSEPVLSRISPPTSTPVALGYTPCTRSSTPSSTSFAAEYLVEIGVETVGVDYLSVEPFEDTEFHTHHTLLGADVVILEGLMLADVEPGEYFLVCLPLKLRGSDGSPARAILIRNL